MNNKNQPKPVPSQVEKGSGGGVSTSLKNLVQLAWLIVPFKGPCIGYRQMLPCS
jgi:hypothetical protein